MITQLLAELARLAAGSKIRSVMLTGGRSAKALYQQWHNAPEFCHYQSAKFYFGDERCVAADHIDSNYRMAHRAFAGAISRDQFARLQGAAKNPLAEAARYAALLPDRVDLVLLSMGEEGHIASLFPYSVALRGHAKVAYVADAAKPPSERFTITPSVIQSARHAILMAAGRQKGQILRQALHNPKNIDELPVRLTIGRTWVLDQQATNAFLQDAPENYHNTKIIHA